MTVEEFEASDGKEFSGCFAGACGGMAQGDWEKAHEVAQDVAGSGWGLGACLSASQGGGFGECGLLVSAGGEGCGGGGFAGGVGGDCGGDVGAVKVVALLLRVRKCGSCFCTNVPCPRGGTWGTRFVECSSLSAEYLILRLRDSYLRR